MVGNGIIRIHLACIKKEEWKLLLSIVFFKKSIVYSIIDELTIKIIKRIEKLHLHSKPLRHYLYRTYILYIFRLVISYLMKDNNNSSEVVFFSC